MSKDPGVWLCLAFVCLIGIVVCPAAAATMRGWVVDGTGEPVKDAAVWAVLLETTGPLERLDTRTDGHGAFRLELTPGRWFVRASHGVLGGPEGLDQLIVVSAETEPLPKRIVIRPLGILHGQIVDAQTGDPLIGARFAVDDGTVAATDERGRFEIRALSLGPHEAYIVADGYERRRVLFDTGLRPVAHLELHGQRGGRVTGVVTDEQGTPIADATVGRETSGKIVSGAALHERTDAQGRFTWDGIGFDHPWRLTIHAPGYESLDVKRPPLTFTQPLVTVNVSLRREAKADRAQEPKMAPPPVEAGHRIIEGIVVGPDARPVAGATVRWGTFPDSNVPQDRTNHRGEFRLDRASVHEGYLAVLARGFAPALIHVPAGGEQELRIVLSAGRMARGVVRDAEGRPLEGVSVMPLIPCPTPHLCNPLWLHQHETRTDAQGRFDLEGLPEGGVLFDFVRPDLSDLRSQPLEFDGAVNQVVMTATGAIRGRVVDAAGEPVRNFRILVDIPRQREPGENFGGFFAGYQGIGLSFTAEDGSFVISDLVSDRLHRITAVAEGYGAASEDRVMSRPLNALPPTDELVLRLSPPHTLAVRVVRAADGAAVSDARVALVSGEERLDTSFRWGYDDASWNDVIRRRSDEQGIARFDGLPYGEGTLVVEHPHFAVGRAGWRDGGEQVTLELQPAGRFRGEFRHADGSPLTDAWIMLTGQMGDSFSGEVEDGVIAFDRLPAGTYDLDVSAKGGATLLEQQVTIDAGEQRDFQWQAEAP